MPGLKSGIDVVDSIDAADGDDIFVHDLIGNHKLLAVGDRVD